MEKFFGYIQKGLTGQIDYFEFSMGLEQYLVDHYDEMFEMNPIATEYLNDKIPDETEKMEPGMDPSTFYENIRKIVEKSKEL